MAHIVTVGPASEPLVLADVKLALKVDTTADDDYITSLIVRAREITEGYTSKKIFTQTVQEVFDCFPGVTSSHPRGELKIMYGPIQSIDSVQYVDGDGVPQTWDSANYRVDIISDPALITPAFGLTWPSARDITNAVTVEYTAGHATVGAIPEAYKSAMLLLIGHMYEKRIDSVRRYPTQFEWVLRSAQLKTPTIV